jgi:TonB family protein
MKKTAVIISVTLFLCYYTTLVSYSQSYAPASTYGESKLIPDFFCSEVTYPEMALENDTEGDVVIAFTVEKDGKVSKAKVSQSVSPEVDDEALRLFRMLLWEPAISMGQPVVSENLYTIGFNIKKYNKHCRQRGYVATDYPFHPIDTSNILFEYSATEKKPYAVFEEKGMTVGAFIARNIKYPESAYRQNLSGKVGLRFVVEPSGRVSNIKALAPVGGGCTQEAIRLLQLLRWMPGIKNGMAVRTFMNIDIEFKLPEDSDMNIFENGSMNSN